MNRKTSRRRQIAVRTAVYTLMTLSVVVVVSVLMLIVLGYSFNRQDGRIERGGLLQFASIPSGATVTLDSQRLSSRTPSKTHVDTSSHHVEMTLSGYKPWRKTVTVPAGAIGWLNYARLVPEKITTQSLRTFPELTGSIVTENGEWMLLHEAKNQPEFTLVDLRSSEPKYEAIALPETLYTAPAEGEQQEFTLVDWSENGRQALLLHVYGGEEKKREWIVLDRTDVARSINISTLYAIDIQRAVFGTDNGQRLFAHIAGENNVRSVNLDNQTISRPLATNVEQFSVYEQRTLVFTTYPDETGARSIGYATEDTEAAQIVRSFAAESAFPYMAFGEYYDRRYVAIVADGTLEVLRGDLPTASSQGSLTTLFKRAVVPGAQSVEFSETGRFVVVQRADGYATYDIEQKKFSDTTLKRASESARPLTWLDNYMLWDDRGGVLRLYEFDGANQNDIVEVAEGHAVTLRESGKFVYSFGRSDEGLVLQRSLMRIN